MKVAPGIALPPASAPSAPTNVGHVLRSIVPRGPDFPPRNEGLPTFALAITYLHGNLHSVGYRLYQMPESER